MTTPKKLWKVIKQVMRSFKKPAHFTEINGKHKPSEIAEEMNRFFTDIGPGLAMNIPHSLLNLNFSPDENLEKLELTHTDFAKVHKLLMKISASKATGSDGIPVRFIKLCANSVIPIIVHIINRSIDTCIVPNDWKRSKVTALYKDGDGIKLSSCIHTSSIVKNTRKGCPYTSLQIYAQ